MSFACMVQLSTTQRALRFFKKCADTFPAFVARAHACDALRSVRDDLAVNRTVGDGGNELLAFVNGAGAAAQQRNNEIVDLLIHGVIVERQFV